MNILDNQPVSPTTTNGQIGDTTNQPVNFTTTNGQIGDITNSPIGDTINVASQDIIDSNNSNSLSIDDIEKNLESLVEKYVNPKSETNGDYEHLSQRLEALEMENKRLTSALGKMVTVYGARFSEENEQTGIEAFPQLPVTDEAKLDENQIVSLNDIVLGS